MVFQISWRPHIVLLVEPTLSGSPPVLCVARFSNAVTWLHIQDFEVDVAFMKDLSSARLKRWAQWFERLVLRRFDRVSAISDRMVERLSTKGVDAGKKVLFPNWVDTTSIYPLRAPSPLRKKLGISDREHVALYSGNMGMKQGLELLAEASRLLAFRSDIRLVFCGDGPYRGELVRTTAGNPNVTFLELQSPDKFNELLNVADIHLLPQRAGAADLVMPSKLTGMMASGRAVVAAAQPGTQITAVLEGRGVVTPPGDASAFADAIARLVDDPETRLAMGRNARRYAVDHMARDRILAQFELSLMQACGQSRPSGDEGPTADSPTHHLAKRPVETVKVDGIVTH